MITANGTRIEVACDTCGKPVSPGEGHLKVDDRQAIKVVLARRDFNQRHPNGISGEAWQECFDLPAAAPWQAYHLACDPDPECVGYWFDVGRCDTWPKLVRRTAHLMSKTWLSGTDWREVLDRLGEGA